MTAGSLVRPLRGAGGKADGGAAAWVRRARPLLGTLVEIGALRSPHSNAEAAIGAAFASIAAAPKLWPFSAAAVGIGSVSTWANSACTRPTYHCVWSPWAASQR